MFFQPEIPVILIVAGLLAFAIYKLARSKSRPQRYHWGLRTAALLLILLAGFRPSAPTLAPTESYHNRYDVYIVTDLTGSMVAEDWDGDQPRLDGVRDDINTILDEYVGAKFSLITFNNSTMVRSPLTPNSSAIASAANTMLPELTALSSGSSISQPVEELESILKRDSDQHADRAKILLYLGDGEQTVEEAPASFEPLKQYLTSAKVYGYGTVEGGKMKSQHGVYISTKDNEYITDADGNVGLSILDEDNLEAIAEQLGGTYEHRTADVPLKVPTLSKEARLELSASDTASVANTQEFYWLFLTPVALIMFMDAALIFRKTRQLGAINART